MFFTEFAFSIKVSGETTAGKELDHKFSIL